MNAIMYLIKTGSQWRMLPKDFPPNNIVFRWVYRPRGECPRQCRRHRVPDTMREKGMFPKLRKILADGGYKG